MGLRSIARDVRRLLLLRRLQHRLREEMAMGRLKAVIFGACGAVLTSIVAQVTGACPDLLSQAPAIFAASVGAAAAYLLPKTSGAKATVAGCAAALVAGLMQQLTAICGATFVEQLPALATAGLWIGIGAYLTAHGKE